MTMENEAPETLSPELTKLAAKEEGMESAPRQLPHFLRLFVRTAAILFTLYELYFCAFGIMEAYFVRSSMLMVSLLLVFLTKPVREDLKNSKKALYVDYLLVLVVLAIGFYIFSGYPDILLRTGAATSADLIVGAVLMLVVMEGSRRVMGPAMTIVVIVLLAYTMLGRHFPGPLRHPGMSLQEIIEFSFLGTQGIFGVTLDVIATAVFPFVIFGSFLLETGASNMFLDVSRSLMGHRAGGPAKVSVISSALVGTVSGSAVANVIVDGVFNIPLMKKQGYPPIFAGGVEAVASTGGQIMPPVMAAAAFIMAGFVGVSYSQVAIAAAFPSRLYFCSVWASTHFVAKREG